jgi:uncharacterized membrane protein
MIFRNFRRFDKSSTAQYLMPDGHLGSGWSFSIVQGIRLPKDPIERQSERKNVARKTISIALAELGAIYDGALTV